MNDADGMEYVKEIRDYIDILRIEAQKKAQKECERLQGLKCEYFEGKPTQKSISMFTREIEEVQTGLSNQNGMYNACYAIIEWIDMVFYGIERPWSRVMCEIVENNR